MGTPGRSIWWGWLEIARGGVAHRYLHHFWPTTEGWKLDGGFLIVAGWEYALSPKHMSKCLAKSSVITVLIIHGVYYICMNHVDIKAAPLLIHRAWKRTTHVLCMLNPQKLPRIRIRDSSYALLQMDYFCLHKFQQGMKLLFSCCGVKALHHKVHMKIFPPKKNAGSFCLCRIPFVPAAHPGNSKLGHHDDSDTGPHGNLQLFCIFRGFFPLITYNPYIGAVKPSCDSWALGSLGAILVWDSTRSFFLL